MYVAMAINVLYFAQSTSYAVTNSVLQKFLDMPDKSMESYFYLFANCAILFTYTLFGCCCIFGISSFVCSFVNKVSRECQHCLVKCGEDFAKFKEIFEACRALLDATNKVFGPFMVIFTCCFIGYFSNVLMQSIVAESVIVKLLYSTTVVFTATLLIFAAEGTKMVR